MLLLWSAEFFSLFFQKLKQFKLQVFLWSAEFLLFFFFSKTLIELRKSNSIGSRAGPMFCRY